MVTLRNTVLRTMTIGAVLCGLAAPAAAQAVRADDGATGLGLALRRLGTTKRVLMIGAHPDDEDTALLAQLALGDGAEVAYLSLTRGEGGQNLIGPELQEGLGLIRTEELLAARRFDGARQYFSRAYDFGFSKIADEAFRHWPRDSVLEDVVEVVRRFRPDLIIPVFSGTPRDGHGQHQVSGIVAREAFTAAADPSVFPAQIAAGLRPWQASYLYQGYRGRDAPITIPTGDLDPLFGRSHYQIAMSSRSRHRSQDMGQVEEPGPHVTTLMPVAGPIPPNAGSAFAGLDTTLSMRARTLQSAAGAPPALGDALVRYEEEIDAIRATFNPLSSASLAPRIAAAAQRLGRAATIASGLGPAAADLTFRIAAEMGDLHDALRRAAGIVVDVTSEDDRIVAGQEFEMAVSLWNGGRAPVSPSALEPLLPAGWTATALDAFPTAAVEPGTLFTRHFRVRVAADAAPSEPYYLRRPRAGDLYAWPADPSLHGLPFEPAAVRAIARIDIAGEPVSVEEEATFVDVDKAIGELRRPVLVLPAIGVTVEPRTTVLPLATRAAAADNGSAQPPGAREVTVVVRSEAPDSLRATARLEAPRGWRVSPASAPLAFAGPAETHTLRFTVTPPAGLAPGRYDVHAVVEAAGVRYERGYDVIAYPHTRERVLSRDATAAVSAFDVAVAPGLRVGYIEGAGDDGAASLEQLGVQVEKLDATALASGDLSRYDAIVTGIRAYEVRPDLAAHNDRVLAYAREGGTVIVQYNKYEYPRGNFAPYPLTMASPHDRVTDEAADVKLLEPDHPILSSPNRIGPSDFTGWVQERGLYFAHTWDDHYQPLLEMHDPGEDPLRGGMLYAKYGEGSYVYTGIAFFRQLPEGVPGAWRLLANLVSLGARSGRPVSDAPAPAAVQADPFRGR